MKEVSKFIPMVDSDVDNSQSAYDSNVYGKVVTGSEKSNGGNASSFKVCNSNLPTKPTIWSKLRGILTYEIKVELTPYQQKIEDEINEFLHQEITWQSFKNFLFQDITFGKKA